MEKRSRNKRATKRATVLSMNTMTLESEFRT